MSGEQPLDLDKDHVRKTVGGIQFNLLDDLIVDCEREAAGFAGGIERKNADAHGTSLYTLSIT